MGRKQLSQIALKLEKEARIKEQNHRVVASAQEKKFTAIELEAIGVFSRIP